jgi:putative restriction endonuclease
MPALQPEELVEAIVSAIQDSGCSAQIISPLRRHPRRFLVSGPHGHTFLSVYAWTLTFGGRPSLANEFRIQMTSVSSPLQVGRDGPTILIGYEPHLKLFAGFDLARHRIFTAGSPSVQMDVEELKRAEFEGLTFHRKSNDEIAIGIRPDQLVTYALNSDLLHKFGKEANVFKLLHRATKLEEITVEDVTPLSAERQRVVQSVSRLSRIASFRRQVLFAYGQRCAVTRVQLRLVDAAHILPVGAPGSTDHVKNGIALSPTYHRAFDYGLIYLDEDYRMRLNDRQVHLLSRTKLGDGVDDFKAPLGRIFLPPDRQQWPSAEMIDKANEFRQVQA